MMMNGRLAALAIAALISACSADLGSSGPDGNDPAGGNGTGNDGKGPDGNPAPGNNDPGSTPAAPSSKVTVKLSPESAGQQRVNFAVPFGKGWLKDETRVRVLASGAEQKIARRVLSKHEDGSVRSLQIQLDMNVSADTEIEVAMGEPGAAADLPIVAVEQTLLAKSGSQVPRTWAMLPATWLATSAFAGPLVPEAESTGALAAFGKVCNYTRFNADAFVSLQSDSSVWLYDRPTALYRGYARRGDKVTLASAYREVGMYRAGLKGTGAQTTIGLADKATDLKYYYTQGLALHFLMTGDDRYREAAENVADRIAALWPKPEYTGGFWTERHAGFALLGYIWAEQVSDDKKARYADLADAAVAGYVKTQEKSISGYADKEARCFAHTADSAGEPFGYTGCSPWLSAILADGLEAYGRERTGDKSQAAKTSIVKLGRILAKNGRDGDGKPFYWMGVGTSESEADPDDEHWGEPAYVVAMAWHYDGRKDASLRATADQLLAGLGENGTAPHMRSFNWQCRSAIGASYFLK
jgi:hypothetical protein